MAFQCRTETSYHISREHQFPRKALPKFLLEVKNYQCLRTGVMMKLDQPCSNAKRYMLCIGLSFVYAKGFDITLMEYMNHFL